MFLSPDQYPSRTTVPGRCRGTCAADHGSTLPRLRHTGGDGGVRGPERRLDHARPFSVARMDGVLKIGSADAAVVTQPSASNDEDAAGLLTPIALTERLRRARAPAAQGEARGATRPAPNNPTNRSHRGGGNSAHTYFVVVRLGVMSGRTWNWARRSKAISRERVGGAPTWPKGPQTLAEMKSSRCWRGGGFGWRPSWSARRLRPNRIRVT